jgi:putative ABC transport system ATP-binding protein
LAILAGLDRPSSGSIQIAGQRIDALDEEEMTRFRGKNLGFVFQSYHLIPTLTALENAMLPLELQGQSLSQARDLAAQELQRLGLSDRLDHLPRQLSGGEQQRVAIARALVSRPRVIFADEPTGNLDSSNALKILDYLLALRGRTTVMLVTHDANLAARADRVLRLKDGALA